MSGLIVHLVHFCPVQITKQFSILIFGIEIFVSMCYFDIFCALPPLVLSDILGCRPVVLPEVLYVVIYENSIEKEQDS